MNRLPLDFVGTLIEALLIFILYMVTHGRRQEINLRPVRIVLFMLLFAVMNNLVGAFMPDGISSFVITLLGIGMVYGFLRANLLASVIIVISSMLIVKAVEIPVVLLAVVFTGKEVGVMVTDDALYTVLFGITKSLEVLIGYLLYRSRISFQKYRPFRREASLLSNLLIQSGLIALLVYISTSGAARNSDPVLYTVFSFGALLLLFAIGALDLAERERTVRMLGEYHVQENQIQQMKEAMAIIRREKHDFANHIATIQGIVSLKRSNALDLIGSYLEGVGIALQRTFRTFDTGNDYLDGLLALKHHRAQEQGITLQVDINAPFHLLSLPRMELISVVSNLVDNAFDSFDGISVEEPCIHVETCLKDGWFQLAVRDNGRQIPMEISERIFKEGFSTKNKADGERGYGLAITKRIVETGKGSIQVVSNAAETEFLILLPVEARQAAG